MVRIHQGPTITLLREEMDFSYPILLRVKKLIQFDNT